MNNNIETLILSKIMRYNDNDEITCKLNEKTFAEKTFLKKIYITMNLEDIDE